MNIHDIISKAKVRLLLNKDAVFFSTLVCNLDIEVTDNVATGATDSKKIYINESFFKSLSPAEQEFLLAHEALHVAYYHTTRMQNKDRKLFNCACDYVINLELVSRNFSLIEGGLYDESYIGLSAEQVYELLLKQAEHESLDDSFLDIMPCELSQEDKLEIDSKIIQASQQAQIANAIGSIPEELQRYIQSLTKPLVNWRTVLNRFLQRLDKTLTTWSKPRKKYLHTGLYLPSLTDSNLTNISFAIDTSGSISTKQFNQFISEVSNVFKYCKAKEFIVYIFDYGIKSKSTVKSIQDIKDIQFMGGGGTDIYHVFNDFKQHPTQALIIITDGYLNQHRLPKLQQPILWIVFDNPEFIPKQGKALHITLPK